MDWRIDLVNEFPDGNIIVVPNVSGGAKVLFQLYFTSTQACGFRDTFRRSVSLTSARKYTNVVSSGGTTMSQGTVERMTKGYFIHDEDQDGCSDSAWIGRFILYFLSFWQMWTSKSEDHFRTTFLCWRLFVSLCINLKYFKYDSHSRPSMTSTCDSAESIASPFLQSDLDDDQIRKSWLHHSTYSRERTKCARDFHSFRENSVTSSSHFQEGARKFASMFSDKESSDREGISSGHQPFQGEEEEAARLVLVLAEAKSEILKQESKVDTLSTCIREFQRQAHVNRLKKGNVEDSRIGSTRKSTSKYSHQKYPWSGRFWREPRKGELTNSPGMNWESRAIFQELTSQIQELHERMNYMNDSGQFQDIESICSGNLFTIPSKLASVPSLCGDVEPRPFSANWTWNLLGTSGNVFESPRAVINQFVIDSSSRNASLSESKCYRRKSSAR